MRREREQIRTQSGPVEWSAGAVIPVAPDGPNTCTVDSHAIEAGKQGAGGTIGAIGTLGTLGTSGTGECRRLRQSSRSGQIARRWLGLIVVCLLASVGSSWAVDAPPLDLNRATETELAALPGIGKVRAQAIARRRAELRFARPEELLGVPGIGPSIYAGLRDRIEVSPEPDPVRK